MNILVNCVGPDIFTCYNTNNLCIALVENKLKYTQKLVNKLFSLLNSTNCGKRKYQYTSTAILYHIEIHRTSWVSQYHDILIRITHHYSLFTIVCYSISTKLHFLYYVLLKE